jgi:hypothetical protein
MLPLGLFLYQPKIMTIFIYISVYLDMGVNPGDTATLEFSFGAGTSGNRIWELKVTQIKGDSDIRYL